MNRRRSRSIAVLVAIITMTTVLASQTAAGADVVLTFTPTDDATIRESSPTTNYGSRTSLEVDASSRKDILLRFDISGVGSSNVSSATLRLYNIDRSPSGGDFTVVTNTAWSENTVTWANAPAADGTYLGSLGSVSPGNWYELDVTALVTGDGPVSLRISSTNSNGADYASTENSNGNGPQLDVVLGDPPVPDFEPPTAPGNLIATDVQASYVSLSWDASTDNIGVTAYDIYRDGSLHDSVGAVTTYQDTTVAPETTYQYFVRARDAAGNVSDSSNTVQVTTPEAQPATFDVWRDGSVYHAAMQAGPSAYTGTLKFVVESALDDLKAAGGGTILFAAGDLDLGSDHFEIDGVNDVAFIGQGMGVTTIRNFTNASADTEPFDAVRSDRLTIRDLTVSAGGSDRTTSDALDFDGGDDILIERVEVTDSRGRGIIFDGKDAVGTTGGTADRNVVRDCVVTNTPRDGIQLLASNFNTIEGCHISNTGAEGIRVHKASSSAGQPNKPSNDNLIVGNTIENSADNGIAVTSGNRNVISGNTVLNNGQSGILVFTSSSSLVCDDNVVEFNSAQGNDYGLEIADSECHRTVVRDNDFTGNNSGEILDNGTDTIYTSSDSEPPSAPGNLVATDVQASQVTLNWDASTDNIAVTAYDIYRDGTLHDSVGPTTSYQDNAVGPETTYQYVVRARDGAGNISDPSNTVSVTTPPGPPITTFTPTDDATIRESSPTTNYGSRTSLEVDASSRKDILLRFDINGIGSSNVTSATLRLYNIDSSSSGGDFTIVTNTAWTEDSVTWANAPAADGAYLGSLGRVSSGNWYELDVTALVTGDGPVSLRISSTNSNGADYASTENSNGNGPQLVVVTD